MQVVDVMFVLFLCWGEGRLHPIAKRGSNIWWNLGRGRKNKMRWHWLLECMECWENLLFRLPRQFYIIQTRKPWSRIPWLQKKILKIKFSCNHQEPNQWSQDWWKVSLNFKPFESKRCVRSLVPQKFHETNKHDNSSQLNHNKQILTFHCTIRLVV